MRNNTRHYTDKNAGRLLSFAFLLIFSWTGIASYYSESGCLECSPTLTMANGQRLDDTKLTLAMTPRTVRKFKILNKKVTVRNRTTGASIVATVTDTGGFARYNRIADLSVATKLAIGCGDLCKVEITYQKKGGE